MSHHPDAARKTYRFGHTKSEGCVDRSLDPITTNSLESGTRATRHSPTDASMEKRYGHTESVETDDGSPLRRDGVGLASPMFTNANRGRGRPKKVGGGLRRSGAA